MVQVLHVRTKCRTTKSTTHYSACIMRLCRSGQGRKSVTRGQKRTWI